MQLIVGRAIKLKSRMFGRQRIAWSKDFLSQDSFQISCFQHWAVACLHKSATKSVPKECPDTDSDSSRASMQEKSRRCDGRGCPNSHVEKSTNRHPKLT